jgi:hypothetical protein
MYVTFFSLYVHLHLEIMISRQRPAPSPARAYRCLYAMQHPYCTTPSPASSTITRIPMLIRNATSILYYTITLADLGLDQTAPRHQSGLAARKPRPRTKNETKTHENLYYTITNTATPSPSLGCLHLHRPHRHPRRHRRPTVGTLVENLRRN